MSLSLAGLAQSRLKPFANGLFKTCFPEGYELLPGTSQIYELQLAFEESQLLSPKELIERGAYFASIKGTTTTHFRMCGVTPVQVDANASARRKSFFEANLFKTGYATHGLFPYRGKFHPQMVKSIINVMGLEPGDTLLDPMCGSGTACVEASLMGTKSIGIDASPFCCLMGRAKYSGARLPSGALDECLKQPEKYLDHFDSLEESQQTLFRKNPKQPKGKSSIALEVEELLKLCYLDAVGYARRRMRKTVRDLFEVVLSRYVSAVETFAKVRHELGIHPAEANFIEGDACDLKKAGILDASIDGILTSPPYSFAIDYVDNDSTQLEYMGIKTDMLRGKMIGLKGDSLEERFERYISDMERVMSEAHRVLKAGCFCVVLVGTNSNQLKRAMGTASEKDLALDLRLNEIAARCGFTLQADLIHPIEGIHNIMRDEHILFYKK